MRSENIEPQSEGLTAPDPWMTVHGAWARGQRLARSPRRRCLRVRRHSGSSRPGRRSGDDRATRGSPRARRTAHPRSSRSRRSRWSPRAPTCSPASHAAISPTLGSPKDRTLALQRKTPRCTASLRNELLQSSCGYQVSGSSPNETLSRMATCLLQIMAQGRGRPRTIRDILIVIDLSRTLGV